MGLPRITYNSINIDFDRCLNSYEHRNLANVVRNQTVNGKIETLYFSNSEALEIEKQRMSGTIEAQLEQFWEYARSGQSFSFRFDRELLAYWAFENDTETNDKVAISFSRGSTGNYINVSTGLITSAASGAARFESGKYGYALLMEKASTNLLLHSNDASNAAWVKTNITETANSTQTLDPAGGLTSDLLTITNTGATLVQTTSTAIGTNDGCLSVYLKAGINEGGVKLRLRRSDTSAVLSEDAAFQTVTNEWQRFDLSYTTAGNIAANWVAELEFDFTASTAIYFYNAQLEAQDHATSPIATTTATVTRSADAISFNARNFFDAQPLRGTIMFWIKPLWEIAADGTVFQVENAADASILSIAFDHASDNIVCRAAYEAGATSGNLEAQADATAFTAGTWVHVAFTWDYTTYDAIVYINGALADSETNPGDGVNPRIIEDASDSGLFGGINALLDDFEIRKNVMTAAEILAVYNSSRQRGWRRNYFSSLVLNQDEYAPRLIQGAYRHDVPLKFLEQK